MTGLCEAPNGSCRLRHITARGEHVQSVDHRRCDPRLRPSGDIHPKRTVRGKFNETTERQSKGPLGETVSAAFRLNWRWYLPDEDQSWTFQTTQMETRSAELQSGLICRSRWTSTLRSTCRAREAEKRCSALPRNEVSGRLFTSTKRINAGLAIAPNKWFRHMKR